MGYFGKQIYNEPMSMYVDPRLDILANSLQAVQKRHDENYAQMSALDLMAHNTAVLEGDKGIKDAALGRLKAQRDAIAASGDYAYAMPKIGAAVRDWGGDENLIAAKENKSRIDKTEELRQQMRAAGHIDLDFAPSDKFSTIDPATGQRRLYTSKLEKQLDYDARAQEVSKLIADTRNLGLTPANIRDYLQSGSISGISDAKVRANLEGAISRFMESPEGNQMKRKLTQIDGMDADQADNHIANFLYGVSKAQVHEKVDINYQVNQPAVQRENREDQQAHDRAQSELAFKRSMALQAAKDEADLAKAAAKTKTAKEEALAVAPSSILLSAASASNANGSFGTNGVNENAAGVFFPSVNIKDPETGNTFTGMRVPMETATLATKYNPETGNFTKDEIGLAKDYFIREDRLKEARKELENVNRLVEFSPGASGPNASADSRRIKDKQNALAMEVQRLERGYADSDLEAIRFTNRANGKTPAEIENAVKTYQEKYKHKGILTADSKEKKFVEGYRTAFQNDGAKKYESVGKKLAGQTVDATFSNREPTNMYRVDGVLHGNFETKMSGKELTEKLGDDLGWAAEHGLVTGSNGTIEDDKYYGVNFVSKIPEDAPILEALDNKVMGTTDAAKNHAEYVKQNTLTKKASADMNSKMQRLEANTNVSDDPTKPLFYREYVKRELLKSIDKDVDAQTNKVLTQIKDKAQQELYLNQIANQKQKALENVALADKFNDLDKIEQEAFIKYLQANEIL